jgi:selenium metabolism protein YedF
MYFKTQGADEMKTIDVLAKPCPIPVIEAKKALTEQGEESVLVKVDNLAAVRNLEKMAAKYGHDFSLAKEAQDLYEVIIQKKDSSEPQNKMPDISPNSVTATATAVVVSANVMGKGEEELGKILIKGFIYSLTELPTPPAFLIFFNSGAYLTCEGANTLEDLKKLAAKGTTILTCGTCLNYYGLQDKLAVGTVANMYEIVEKMDLADKVINI